ncbi:hypothetical protein FEAC_19820 [Ferrimicrobium acidiphilum DSM 19497]|uniref:Uncharacterized protein n=1 Tax=Ferrimicrobium acidiphilum DSM 19497 TaxID=1121877 RepID=A0A0D8FVI2_9ACTN|nr:hypothetical protein FEAC_19820 [Ferrimicrobium acidiphilum DSM 19497]
MSLIESVLETYRQTRCWSGDHGGLRDLGQRSGLRTYDPSFQRFTRVYEQFRTVFVEQIDVNHSYRCTATSWGKESLGECLYVSTGRRIWR